MKNCPGAADRVAVGELYLKVKKEFGDRINVDFYDPRCVFFFITALRHNVHPHQPTWIMNGKVIFRGVPAWEELKAKIETEL